MDLMTFQTIDKNVTTFQVLEFRLITTSKNNMSEIDKSRSTLFGFLFFPLFLFFLRFPLDVYRKSIQRLQREVSTTLFFQ